MKNIIYEKYNNIVSVVFVVFSQFSILNFQEQYIHDPVRKDELTVYHYAFQTLHCKHTMFFSDNFTNILVSSLLEQFLNPLLSNY